VKGKKSAKNLKKEEGEKKKPPHSRGRVKRGIKEGRGVSRLKTNTAVGPVP